MLRVCEAARTKWPTRSGRLLATATDENQREMIEKDERNTWLRELRKIVADSKGGVDAFEEPNVIQCLG